MPLIETESLVLRSYNLAEADRIVVFFTREHGIVRGVARGAKRLKSRFGSTLEPFSTVNLSYFQKEDRELVSVQSVELAYSRFDSASNPTSLETYSYIADLLIALLPPHDPSETVYRMTKACLDAASSDSTSLAAVRLYFELWLLRLVGYLPSWAACFECGREIIEGVVSVRPDYSLVCSGCGPSRGRTQLGEIHRQLFWSAQKEGPSAFVSLFSPEQKAVAELSAILRRIVSQAAGRDVRMLGMPAAR